MPTTSRDVPRFTPSPAGPAFDEIARGKTEFRPSPQETREILAKAYAAPATLLLRFADDRCAG